ncbi:MAG: DUF4314 domain-containing protein [Lachnospiraceae bacterium]|nr:DUF4314 domain-containing protein [Lachnospiraceae bacterium]MCD8382801.1 DUF4314 domain-containing protein [Clostridiales bacterium]
MNRGWFPSREQVEALRQSYPVGCRIELLGMDDRQAPPIGTQGTVMGVDDAGQIMMAWDTGSSLSLLPDVDRFQKV